MLGTHSRLSFWSVITSSSPVNVEGFAEAFWRAFSSNDSKYSGVISSSLSEESESESESELEDEDSSSAWSSVDSSWIVAFPLPLSSGAENIFCW